MTNGGNAIVKEFFNEYGLFDLSIEERYNSKAANFHRENVRFSYQIHFLDESTRL